MRSTATSSTAPGRLTQVYDEEAFIEIDRRTEDALASELPIVWDHEPCRAPCSPTYDVLDSPVGEHQLRLLRAGPSPLSDASPVVLWTAKSGF